MTTTGGKKMTQAGRSFLRNARKKRSGATVMAERAPLVRRVSNRGEVHYQNPGRRIREGRR